MKPVRLQDARKALQDELDRIEARRRELDAAVKLLDKNKQAWETIRVVLSTLGIDSEEDSS